MSSISFRALVEGMEGQDLVLGAVLLGAGLVFMIVGARLFKMLLALSFAGVGLALGASLPISEPYHWVVGAAVGLGLALISTLVAKVAVGVLAGGWAGLAVAAALMGVGVSDQVVLIVGGVICAVVISLTFVLYQEIIAAVMSFEGTLLFLAGLIVFLSHSASGWAPLRAMFLDMPFFGAFLLIAGTVTGFYLQVTELQKRQVGTSG